MIKRGQMGKEFGADRRNIGNNKCRNLKTGMNLVLLREIMKASVATPRLEVSYSERAGSAQGRSPVCLLHGS